uniref:CUB domain-containing protein n=1 Tax=Strigamia maritima TaxID=126957 RepID=T1JB68_STRMM
MPWSVYLAVTILLLPTCLAARKVLSVQELCVHNLMRPVVRLSTNSHFVSALGLVLEGLQVWPRAFDCTLTLQVTEPKTVIGLSLDHLQLRTSNNLECLDYLEINDGNNAIRLCGDTSNQAKEMQLPSAIPTHFESTRDVITIHIFSRPATPEYRFKNRAPSLGFFFNAVAYYKITKENSCNSMNGFSCGEGGRCLPRRLVCDLYPDCGEINANNDEKANCSDSEKIWTRNNDPTLSPITLSFIVTACILSLISITIIFYWSRNHFLKKSLRTTSNQNLTDTSHQVNADVFVIESCHYASIDVASAPSYESLFPSAPTLTPQPSIGNNELPPAYETLFGHTSGANKIDHQTATKENSKLVLVRQISELSIFVQGYKAKSILTRVYEVIENVNLFLVDLCEQNAKPKIHLSAWKDRGEAAVTLSLSKDDYPSGLNCCVSVTSDKKLVVEINDINLPLRPGLGSCLDHLQIESATDILSLCHQKDIGHQTENEASNTIETSHFVDICFFSSSIIEINDDESTQYGFTLRLMAYSQETNTDLCSTIFEGFICHNSTVCLPQSLKCDGEEDCFNGFDEDEGNCKDVTTIAEVASSTIGLSLQGTITLGGIAIIVCAVLVMCMWQCLLKFRSELHNPTSHSSVSQTENGNLPVAIYTVPISNVTSGSTIDIPAGASTSDTADRIFVTCTTARQQRIGDLPPSYDTLFGNNSNNNNLKSRKSINTTKIVFKNSKWSKLFKPSERMANDLSSPYPETKLKYHSAGQWYCRLLKAPNNQNTRLLCFNSVSANNTFKSHIFRMWVA